MSENKPLIRVYNSVSTGYGNRIVIDGLHIIREDNVKIGFGLMAHYAIILQNCIINNCNVGISIAGWSTSVINCTANRNAINLCINGMSNPFSDSNIVPVLEANDVSVIAGNYSDASIYGVQCGGAPWGDGNDGCTKITLRDFAIDGVSLSIKKGTEINLNNLYFETNGIGIDINPDSDNVIKSVNISGCYFTNCTYCVYIRKWISGFYFEKCIIRLIQFSVVYSLDSRTNGRIEKITSSNSPDTYAILINNQIDITFWDILTYSRFLSSDSENRIYTGEAVYKNNLYNISKTLSYSQKDSNVISISGSWNGNVFSLDNMSDFKKIKPCSLIYSLNKGYYGLIRKIDYENNEVTCIQQPGGSFGGSFLKLVNSSYVTPDGELSDILRSGTYANRPLSTSAVPPTNIGFQYFNTDSHKIMTYGGADVYYYSDGLIAAS